MSTEKLFFKELTSYATELYHLWKSQSESEHISDIWRKIHGPKIYKMYLQLEGSVINPYNITYHELAVLIYKQYSDVFKVFPCDPFAEFHPENQELMMISCS